jgi:ABC-type sugar transport system ATPase subunit
LTAPVSRRTVQLVERSSFNYEPGGGVSVVRMRRVVRRFGDSSSVDNVDLDVRAGEVVGLAGRAGAGKSALVDMLAGDLQPDSGQVIVAGNPVLQAASAGLLRVIRRPDALALELSVAQNVCVGAEPRSRLGLVSRRRLLERAREVLEQLDLSVDPRIPARRLCPALRCAVQAANALATGARIIALDGVSAGMTAEQTRILHAVVGKLAEAGVAVIYTGRCARELRDVCDRVIVLGSTQVRDIKRQHEPDEPALEVRGLRTGDEVRDVSFGVASGEIVAVIGNGRSDVGKALFGVVPALDGEILLHGERLRLRTPRDAVRAGVGYVGDWQSSLVPGQTVAGNLRMLAPAWAWSLRAQRRLVEHVQKLLGVDNLTDGDSRKLALAKWLAAESQVLVLDEPGCTTDAEIRWMIRELAAAGVAIVMISSDPAEVTCLADRVVMVRDGMVSKDAVALLTEGAA